MGAVTVSSNAVWRTQIRTGLEKQTLEAILSLKEAKGGKLKHNDNSENMWFWTKEHPN